MPILASAARRLLAVVGLVVALSVTLPVVVASAAPIDDAIAALRTDSVYLDPAAVTPVDANRVREAIGAGPVLVAVLPESSGDPLESARTIGLALPGNTVAVVSGTGIRAGSDVTCAGFADNAAFDAVDRNIDQLNRDGDVTALLVDFVTAMRDAPSQDNCAAAGSGASSSGSSGWVWFAILIAIAVIGVGGYLLYRKRREARNFEGLRADILSMYNRLAADVSNLDPGDDPITRQAVADAAERYTSTGALLDQADTTGEFAAARRTVVEGLVAARTARERLGLDPGPEIPPADEPVGEQLTDARQVTVGDQSYEGFPRYTPGAPHYYRGGLGVPGGWYRTRFWDGMLLGSVLSGGRRRGRSRWGGFGGGGFGGGGLGAGGRGLGSGGFFGGSVGGAGRRGGPGGDWGRGAAGGDWGGGARRGSWGGGRGRGTWGGGGRRSGGGRRGGRGAGRW